MATNACYNAVRARTRRGGPGGETLESVPAGVDEYERAQTAALVEQSLERLNERYRTALVLKDLHGLPPVEIAAVLQVSRPAADVLVHRARASFRSVFRRLAGRDATAPASLGLALLPLSVPAALHTMPPLPAPASPGLHPAPHVPAGTAPHAPTAGAPHSGAHLPALPDPSGLAGPGAVGLLSRLGEALTTKAAATAAAATLLVGGGLAVEHAQHGGHDASTAAAAVRSAGGGAGTSSPAGHWSHHGGWDHYSRWAGHGIEADTHNGEHLAGGHDAAGHGGAGHSAAHDSGTATHDSTTTHDAVTGTHGSGGSSTTGDDHSTTTHTTAPPEPATQAATPPTKGAASSERSQLAL